MNLLRLLKVLLRGLRPISVSLHSISADLHILTRIQTLRLRLEHNEMLTDERLAAQPSKDDLTELSFDVAEPKINPETGKPVIEEDRWDVDWQSIFGNGH